MKKKTKIIAIVLAAVLAATGIGFGVCGCSDSNGRGSEGEKLPVPSQTVTQGDDHKITNGLHKINVTPTDRDYIVDGATEYKYVLPENATAKEQNAARLLVKWTESSSGARLTENDTPMWSETAKLIVLNNEVLFGAAGLSMPSDDIGATGYYITTKGDSVFIMANAEQGVLNGTLEFLYHTVGYEMFADDTVSLNRQDSVKLPAFDVVDKPDFEYFVPSNQMSSTGRTGMRYMSIDEVMMPVGGRVIHNSFSYLNPNDYPDHPEWFALNKEQLCYTARGGLYWEEMFDEFMKKMIKAVEDSPNIDCISITIQDESKHCECDGCLAEKEKYGTDAAAIIKFVNEASRRLDEYLEKKAEAEGTKPRTVYVLFFAYAFAINAPVKLVDGKYVPIDDSVKCGEHVCVYYADLHAHYTKSIYDDANNSLADQIEKWSALSDRLYIWLYETNYALYLYPYNTFESMLDSFRFCKRYNTVYMYPEGQYNQPNVTAFGKFKEYFDSKAMWNVNIDLDEIIDKFFANYFGPAAEPMLEYFEQLRAYLDYLTDTYSDLSGSVYMQIAQARYWPKRLLESWIDLIDKGYELIEPLKESDLERYEVIAKHLKLESIFPRFAQLHLYSGAYTNAELKIMRESFKADALELNITKFNEGQSLEDAIYGSWDM